MLRIPRTSKGFVEGFVVPTVITVFVASGGWIVWVSAASYDANKHVSEFQQVSQELQTVADQLTEIEQTIVLLEVDITSTHDDTNELLKSILDKVSL